MRLNSYVSGIGLGDIFDGTGLDTSGGILDNLNSANYNITPDVSVESNPALTSSEISALSTYQTVPSVNNQVASNSWTSLLQSIIGTGVSTAAHIATIQNAVPQVQPGTYYTYNPQTGQYTIESGTSGSNLFGSIDPIYLLGGAALLVVLIASKGK